MLFKCRRSGNIINIEQPDDVERMKTHEEYSIVEVPVEANTNTNEAVEVTEAPKTEVLKRRGRPRKEEVTEI